MFSSPHFTKNINISETSENFAETRLIFNNETSNTVSTTSQKSDKPKTIKEALDATKTTLTDLQAEVAKNKEDNKINTEEEKAKLLAFTEAHKALDDLKIGITTETQGYVSDLNTNINEEHIKKNINYLTSIHDAVHTIVNEDSEYIKSKEALETTSETATKKVETIAIALGVEKINSLLSKQTITDSQKQEAIRGSLILSGRKNGEIITIESIKTITINKKIIDPNNLIQKYITELVTKNNNDNKLLKPELQKKAIFNSDKGIEFKTEAEIKDEKAKANPNEKKESEQTALEKENALIDSIEINKEEYAEIAKNKGGFLVTLLKYLGIDLGDATKSGGIYGLIRGFTGIPEPKKAKNLKDKKMKYALSSHSDLNSKYLETTHFQAISKPEYDDATLSSGSVGNTSSESLTFLNNNIQAKIMAKDVLGRFPAAKITNAEDGTMTFTTPKNDNASFVQLSTFLNGERGESSSSSIMESGIVEEFSGKLQSAISGLGDIDIGDILKTSPLKHASSYAKEMGIIHEKNGYPLIKNVSSNRSTREITISYKNTDLKKKKSKKKDTPEK